MENHYYLENFGATQTLDPYWTLKNADNDNNRLGTRAEAWSPERKGRIQLVRGGTNMQ